MVIDKDVEFMKRSQTFHNPHKIDAILFSIATHTFVYRILDYINKMKKEIKFEIMLTMESIFRANHIVKSSVFRLNSEKAIVRCFKTMVLHNKITVRIKSPCSGINRIIINSDKYQ